MSAGAVHLDDPDREFKKIFLRAVGASALAHLIFFSAVAVSANFHGPRINEDEIIRVSFMAPAMRPGKPGNPERPKMEAPPPKPETPKPEAKPAPKKEEKVVALNKEPAKKPEAKKPEEKKPEVKKPEPAPKPVETKPEPAPAPPPEELPPDTREDIDLARSMIHGSQPDGEGGRPGMLGGATAWDNSMEAMEGDPRFRSYAEEALVVLREAWRYPPSIPVNQGLHVDVLIQVDKDGNIVSYEFHELSGNGALDKSVQRLMEQVKKLPPVSYINAGQSITIGYSFEPGEAE